MERAFVCSSFSCLDCVTDSFGGLGSLRIFRTVEVARKMFNNASWSATRTRPQLTLDLVISHTRSAISAGVLFAGILARVYSSILCSHR